MQNERGFSADLYVSLNLRILLEYEQQVINGNRVDGTNNGQG